jgi:hypothetical protein
MSEVSPEKETRSKDMSLLTHPINLASSQLPYFLAPVQEQRSSNIILQINTQQYALQKSMARLGSLIQGPW